MNLLASFILIRPCLLFLLSWFDSLFLIYFCDLNSAFHGRMLFLLDISALLDFLIWFSFVDLLLWFELSFPWSYAVLAGHNWRVFVCLFVTSLQVVVLLLGLPRRVVVAPPCSSAGHWWVPAVLVYHECIKMSMITVMFVVCLAWRSD